MPTRTAPELANTRDARQRRNAKWRRSSSALALDQRRSPLENQPGGVFQPSGNFSDQGHVKNSASNLERYSLVNSLANARPESHADTLSTYLHGTHHSHQASIARSAPNPASKPPSFVTSSKSSHTTPQSSVHTSRIHNPRPSSSHVPVTPSSMMDSEIIDLTLEDTEDERSVGDMLVIGSTTFDDQYADPGPSCRTLSSSNSSPIAIEHSLFTPPPPSRRHTRWVVDYLAVPSFPKGLSKADYQPMIDPFAVPPRPVVTNEAVTKADCQPPLDRPVVPPSTLTMATALRESSLDAKERTPDKRKGKERELDVVSPHKKHVQRSPTNGTDALSGAFLDAFFEHTMIPLYDDDTYPPLNTLDLVTNTRFQFAHAWRDHASRLREAELEWVFKFNLLGKTCLWARSANNSSPRLPGTAGYVSSDQLRPWEIVLPESLLQEDTKDVLDKHAEVATGSHTAVQVNVNCLPLPDESLPGPSVVPDPAPSNSTVSQGVAAVETDEMHQYFNGLGDSPAKHVPRLMFPPTHTFRPHLLQSAGNSGMNHLGLGLPSELDPRLADTGDHECFLGVPPSPPPEDIKSPVAPGSIPASPLRPVNFFPASPNNLFDGRPMDAWSFEQGEGLAPDNDPPPNDDVTPTTPGTIDPSLLGPERSSKEPQAPKDSTPKQRSKLPEPVIYIRRPVDPLSLPLMSGKRPVQVKYRDSGASPATTLTRTGSHEASSNPARNSKQFRSDTDDLPRTKRRSLPSRKLRECSTASESDSDYAPEPSTSTSKMMLKIKRPKFKDTGSVVDHQDVGAETVPTMSFCHQCRNKSVRPKMLCSNVLQGRVCGKRFCNRCILYRYPDVTFDEHSAGFLCPVCTNTCNCSFCSRNRGEEFISMRLGGLAASLLKTKVTLVRDVDKPLSTQSPPAHADTQQSVSARTTPTPEPSALPTPSKFWAHVYGMEGERMGSAFMTREHMEQMQTGGPSPPPPPPKQAPRKARKPTKRDKERDTPKGPRVFIGHPLDSWKVRAMRDLAPSVDVEVRTKGKGKERGTSDRPRRCYIGNPAVLYEPYGRMPESVSPTPPPLPSSSHCSTRALDSDGSLTQLSEPEADNWPQPEVGESCSWAPGMIAYPGPSDPVGLSGSFVRELRGPGVPGTVGTWPDVSMEAQGLGDGLPSGSGVDTEINMEHERASPSTVFSEEALARAISAALAALSADASS